MKSDLISIIMSVYNNAKEVGHAIESVVNQSYQNFEFLIVDDNSTDNTLEILKKYESCNSNIKVYSNKQNIGLTKSLNNLIRESGGDFIARQDADDFSFPERLAKQLEFIHKYNLDGCTTRALIKYKSKVKPNLSYYLPNKIIMKLKNPFIHGSLLVKRNSLEEVGYYDEAFYYAQDYKLFHDLLNINKNIRIIKDPLYVLNTQNNISTNFQKEQEYFANCVKKGIVPKID